MSKSNYGCTIFFEKEDDIFNFYKDNKDYIMSMTIYPYDSLMATFKFSQGAMSYIKEKYKNKIHTLHSNSYAFIS